MSNKRNYFVFNFCVSAVLILLIGVSFSRLEKAVDVQEFASVFDYNFLDVKRRSIVDAINSDKPSFDNLYQWAKDAQRPTSKKEIREYIKYYESIVQYFPADAEIYHTLGYLYYYLQDYSRASFLFAKAVQLSNPTFWSYFNLAVMYFHAKAYSQSAVLFEQSLEVDDQNYFASVYGSRVYNMIVNNQSSKQKEIFEDKRKKAIEDAKKYLSICYQRSAKKETQGYNMQNLLDVQIF